MALSSTLKVICLLLDPLADLVGLHWSEVFADIWLIPRRLEESCNSFWGQAHRSALMTHTSGQGSGGLFHLSRVDKYKTYHLGREFRDGSHLAIWRWNSVSVDTVSRVGNCFHEVKDWVKIPNTPWKQECQERLLILFINCIIDTLPSSFLDL